MIYFSVIIPLYNKEKFIEATLRSVLEQSFTDFEILIINDGSTDSSAEIIKKFNDPRIRYFSKENEGVSAARNFGIDKVQGEFIAFIDADDYWYPGFLEEMFQNIKKYPEQKVFSAAIEIETSKSVFPAQYSITKTSDCEIVNYFSASSKETVICTSCAVFNKSIFEEIGNFDTQIKSGQDTDLWIRIGLVHPVVFSWEILTRYVYDENSLSKNISHLNSKVDFSKFKELEKTNPQLKKFLDLNRFSMAIKFKLSGNKVAFDNYYAAIELNNLGIKKRTLLLLPATLLHELIRFKTVLADSGFGSSVFK
ncbi:glycosyltransferase family 2 protein [Flavobacterium degerlachei]|jgi:glycosyltransferase involved in cell wall biosynthesis|uniref:Glycosyltransferase involved in cell wall bisynthesis n=1 Tax=Flavobacterium degerlachei TaxID=229203 RepID=A0A1H2X9V4_9FLAO|nr:glycosyltransferase family 2 protein [Flavobacterium degerlachei]SDW89224.1 Glycosyltransferase involved in cell wall bisynthesis [Flavobacterium degerlachei]